MDTPHKVINQEAYYPSDTAHSYYNATDDIP